MSAKIVQSSSIETHLPDADKKKSLCSMNNLQALTDQSESIQIVFVDFRIIWTIQFISRNS